MEGLAGRKVAVLAENQYEDQELWYPVIRLREAGASVFIVGSGSAPEYRSKHGYPVKVDTDTKVARAADYDAVIIPGGFAPDFMRRQASLVSFVRDAYQKGKVVAAICHAGSVLVSAGILKGKKVTCFLSIKDDVIAAGADYRDEPVVQDGNLITSRQPADLPKFLPAIIEALARQPAGVR